LEQEEDEFNDALQDIQANLEDITVLMATIQRQADSVEASKATKEIIRELKSNVGKVEKTFGTVRDQVKKLKLMVKSEKQQKSYDKLNQKVQKDSDDFFKKKPKFEFLANEKNAVAGDAGAKGSFASSSFNGENDVPVMKVYDQTDFINKREENIQKLNK